MDSGIPMTRQPDIGSLRLRRLSQSAPVADALSPRQAAAWILKKAIRLLSEWGGHLPLILSPTYEVNHLGLFRVIATMTAPLTVKSLDHLVLTVKSIPDSVDFYTTHLGMRHEVFTSPVDPNIQR
jgi:hypothetical protein